MGFSDVKRRVIRCLDTQAFDAYVRGTMAENNLLATGQVSADDVKRIIGRCNGTQYTAKPMSEDPDALKHEMKPVVDGEQWFIWFFFAERSGEMAMFISVHKSKLVRG